MSALLLPQIEVETFIAVFTWRFAGLILIILKPTILVVKLLKWIEKLERAL